MHSAGMLIIYAKDDKVGTFGLDELYPEGFKNYSDITDVDYIIADEIARVIR